MKKEAFIQTIDNLRKASKESWYTWSGVVDGHEVRIKAHKTWLQIYEIDGMRAFCPADCSVSKFIETLGGAI